MSIKKNGTSIYQILTWISTYDVHFVHVDIFISCHHIYSGYAWWSQFCVVDIPHRCWTLWTKSIFEAVLKLCPRDRTLCLSLRGNRKDEQQFSSCHSYLRDWKWPSPAVVITVRVKAGRLCRHSFRLSSQQRPEPHRTLQRWVFVKIVKNHNVFLLIHFLSELQH